LYRHLKPDSEVRDGVRLRMLLRKMLLGRQHGEAEALEVAA
jgi:hypothetical protein